MSSSTFCVNHLLLRAAFTFKPSSFNSSIGIIVHLNNILSCRFTTRNNLIVPVSGHDYAYFLIWFILCMLVFFLIKKYNSYIGGIQDGLYNIKRCKRKMGCYYSSDGLLLFWRTNPRCCENGWRLADTKGRAEANRRQNEARKGTKT